MQRTGRPKGRRRNCRLTASRRQHGSEDTDPRSRRSGMPPVEPMLLLTNTELDVQLKRVDARGLLWGALQSCGVHDADDRLGLACAT
jgi:hypothetical protein